VTSLLANAVDEVLEVSVVGSFSRWGYLVRSRLGEWTTTPPLTGRRALITGATSGLGLECATQLAVLGAQVTFVARDEGRAQRALDAICAAAPSAEVDYLLADTSDLVAIREVALAVARRGPLDLLIHNAGAITPHLTRSAQGYEMTVAAQLLGPFHLTQLLQETLRAAATARVMTVASGGLYTQRFSLAGLEPSERDYDGVVAYARVKRAQLVLNHAWSHHVAARDIVFHSMHPGWTDTPGLASSLPGFHRVMGPILRTPAQGVDTLVWLCAAPEALASSGRLWLDRRPRHEHKVPWTRSPHPHEDQRALWHWCHERTADY
jgi:dehydrogenase/reductase SDR family member 12